MTDADKKELEQLRKWKTSILKVLHNFAFNLESSGTYDQLLFKTEVVLQRCKQILENEKDK